MLSDSTRVLIVDDSAAARQALGNIIATEPDIEVLRPAGNGAQAIERIAKDVPDVVILDVEMPVMDGLAALRVIRGQHPKLPVIMFSALTEDGAMTTIEALSYGATDYLAKPSAVGGIRRTIDQVGAELLVKLRAVTPRSVAPPMRKPRAAVPISRGPKPDRIDAVLIGSSTGGPNALARVLPLLPQDLGVPVLIVQHMPPAFTKHLADRLDRESRLRVFEGGDGMVVKPGEVAIAPGDFHMLGCAHSEGMSVTLTHTEKVQSCRPAVDPLFESAAQSLGSHVLGIVLTGMGQDGLAGAEAIRRAGGLVVAQDQASSVVWGMPGSVTGAGLADEVLPLDQIASCIKRLCQTGVSRTST